VDVRIAGNDWLVPGPFAKAFVKRRLFLAILSRLGVKLPPPMHPTWSALKASTVIRKIYRGFLEKEIDSNFY